MEIKFCSSLAKVMPNETPAVEIRKGCALRGERFSFQIAYHCTDLDRGLLQIEAESPFGDKLRIRKVCLVPVRFAGTSHDDDVIADAVPGLYPDLLTDAGKAEHYMPNLTTWNAAWITVDIPKTWKAGTYKIVFKINTAPMFPVPPVFQTAVQKTFPLEVLDAVVPPQELKHTNWFYADCLATYYNVPVYSEEHWHILGNFMKCAADHGINMLLTPVFTVSLDTVVGGERPTHQLVKVHCKKGKYQFDLSLLKRWIDLAKKSGIRYFEISHLFTQWGAKNSVKVVATVDGKEKRIFGWDVASDSREYAKFLGAFLPVLTDFLKKEKLQDKVYFHCSDEPSADHLESYKYCRALLGKYLKGFKIMDALSHVDFFKQGIVTTPVPIENKFEEFLDAGMKERWTYYCCCPTHVYSNRFIYMPSSRNRIFGALLYKYDIQGFLHWGFNFYNAGLSQYPIDPYQCNDAGYFFPAGDGFLVYPGKNGIPEDSIRIEVFYEAQQDQRVMNALEKLVGREAIVKMLDKRSPGGVLKMADYPRGEKAVLDLRDEVNRMFRKALKKG